MKYKIPKLISYVLYLQIILFAVSLAILNLTSGFDSLVVVYTAIPMIALAPVVTCLAIFLPYSDKKVWSLPVIAALAINTPITLILLIRFVILSFLLHLR